MAAINRLDVLYNFLNVLQYLSILIAEVFIVYHVSTIFYSYSLCTIENDTLTLPKTDNFLTFNSIRNTP